MKNYRRIRDGKRAQLNDEWRSYVVHVSSAHPWTDNRIHLREAQSLASAGLQTSLVAVTRNVEVNIATDVRVSSIRRRSRSMRMSLGVLEAVWHALRTGAKIVHLHDPELIPSIFLFRALGKRVIFDAHEDLENQVRDKHYIPAWAMPMAIAAARTLVRISARADHVIAATEQIATRYPDARVTVVRNFPRRREVETRKCGPSKGRKVAAYVGAYSVTRGAREMIDALASNKLPSSWKLHLAGAPAPYSLKEELQQLPGWKRVNDFGILGPNEARDLVFEARVGLVVFQRTRAHLDSLPTKMFEYMSAGVPIIASDFPLWRSIIEGYECGLLVDETDPHSIAEAIATYDSSPELLDLHGRNARKAAETVFNWSMEEKQLLAVYAELDAF